ncbi:hypothetical protein [Kushneria phosphatilytica]|uniref:Uncharacterized protein n=1 Tax=Kushneria phosphatilytica TaxID=657387 RepID=A0A5C0ZY83_9GAMM|nr:hypothetical protein [Kushneria phosphatilytica]QEL10637.1 hypothetical protein FY550_05495 [Kushneria phosphatilytica]
MREDFYLLNPVPGCSPELAEALINFRDNVTESHTTGSRRWSIWSLVRDALDESVNACLKRHNMENLLSGEAFSEFCKKRSADRADIQISERFKKYKNTSATADADVIRKVLRFCSYRDSKHTSNYYFSKTKTQTNRTGRQKPHCELCWKKSRAAQEIDLGKDFSLESSRFCEEHDPRNPKSLYRTDHNKRDLFTHHLHNVRATGYYYNILDPVQKQHARWVAYRLAQLNVRDRDMAIMDMLIDGVAQAEIARRLGVTRQNISKRASNLGKAIELWKEIKTSTYPIDPEDLAIWDNLP